jgi:hypothetical protein
MRWKVGKAIEVGGYWLDADITNGIAERTPSSPYFTSAPYYTVHMENPSAASRLYDQGDSTVGAAAYQFPLTYVTGVGWRAHHTPIAAMADTEITFLLHMPDHSDTIRDHGWLSTASLDDISDRVEEAIEADIEFEQAQPVQS